MKTKANKDKTPKKSKKGVLIITIALIFLLGFFIVKNKDHASFSPISIVTNVAAADLKETDLYAFNILLPFEGINQSEPQKKIRDALDKKLPKTKINNPELSAKISDQTTHLTI